MNRQRGMTMVELMVSLAIVMLIIGAATTAYLKLLRTYRTQGRLAESYMANLTGLEMLRYDIEMAGFGLPASLTAGATYTEAAAHGANTPAPPYDPSTLNDAVNPAPRAFVQLDNGGANSSDVLAIKSSAANLNPTSKKWSMISRAGSGFQWSNYGEAAALDPSWTLPPSPADMFIILDNTYLQVDSIQWVVLYFQCVTTPNTGYYNDAPPSRAPRSRHPTQSVYYMYGLDNSATHSMPFNRVDYYLDKIHPNFQAVAPQTPTHCIEARSTRRTARSSKLPCIDCVRDFQVAFGLDTSGVDANTIQWQSNLAGLTAAEIQQQLREVRVFGSTRKGSETPATHRASGFPAL